MERFAGVGGQLLSRSFLSHHLDAHRVEVPAAVRRDLQRWRARCQSLGPASGIRALLEAGGEPFARALGFAGGSVAAIRDDVACLTIGTGGQGLVLLVVPWGERLDRFWRPAVVFGREHAAGWALVFNGTHVRLLDVSRVFARRFLDFDIDLALDDEPTLEALWAVLAPASFEPGARGDPPLRQLVVRSEVYAGQVCGSLRDGVLQASAEVLAALTGRRHSVGACFEQALTIVYRVLFLLFAEARGLVPVWHPVYQQSYSLDALRISAERKAAPGIWDTLRAITRLAHTGCRAGTLRVNAFNGRLFAPTAAPLADRRDLDDRAAARALLALATRPAADRAGREAIAYRDLGVEQLGAVYETLLDYTPARTGDAERPVTLRPGSGVRKATGTFYTPQPLASYLVRRTLAPLVRERPPEQVLALRVLDPAMGSGAFLVAAASFLSQAYEHALIQHGGYHPSDFGPPERAAMLRLIAERCLFGVDLNPMAVQLARLSLWLATLAADRPLSFLDHHLQVGDSLLGAWASALVRPPHRRRRSGSDGLPLFANEDVAASLRNALPIRFSISSGPSDTVDQVRAKERALTALNREDGPLAKWKRIADLWCACWFAPPPRLPASAFAVLADAILTGRCELPERAVGRHLADAAAIAAEHRFFHWELEFPEVFFNAAGEWLADAGFDAVLGNPPWDMVRADDGTADQRSTARADTHSYLRFTRESAFYQAQSDGHVNRYQLFVERALALLKPAGRLGLIVPSGLAMDHGSARLRRMLFTHADLDALVGFDNRDAVFPIHRSVRFLLVTATAGGPTRGVQCRLGERSPAVLESGSEESDDGSWFPVRLTLPLIQRLSGEDLTVPDLRSPVDVAIAEKAAALFPPLGSEAGWQARFGRELNASDDRALFRAGGGGLPVIEGKSLDPFRVSPARARFRVTAADAKARLGDRHLRPRLAYRDVASVTNRTTLIAAVLPARCVTLHTVFCLRTRLPLAAQHLLCGLFNSLVVNYLVRLRVTTHVTTAIVERLPVPPADAAPAALKAIAARARLLAKRPDPEHCSEWSELNAMVARLYQLRDEEFAHVLSTFPLVERRARDEAFERFVRATS
jgi:hypothetical protein